MQIQTCKFCNSKLEIEQRCKFCDEPTRLFCHSCGLGGEKFKHPACMMLDVNVIILESFMQKK